MTRVVIVDYGLCNLDSIARGIERQGGDVTVSHDPAAVLAAERVVLPGVGHFAAAMANLRERGLDSALRTVGAGGERPLLAICLGMHLLMERSSEGGAVDGLAVLPGEVVPVAPTAADERVPHMGWNEVESRPGAALFAGIDTGTDFYYAHSYRVACNPDLVLATTPAFGGFPAAIGRGRVFGTQFHPEKSSRAGARLLRNFLAL
ncbi:MAG: imidazole glycerol phosphate synthase subunit HisH [Alphaproteobacteria bacterium]|nr:imidazole glycerol phosphate synthase subunit HisH [Alphaproteobacteria bacterium]